MGKTLADREHTNSYFFKTLDLYFKTNGYKNWTNNDARVLIGKSIVKAATEISNWAGLKSFPNEAVVMRLSEITSKDLRYTYGKIIIDHIKKYGYIPSGYGRGHYATAGDVVDMVNFTFSADGSSDRAMVSDEDLSKRITKGSKIEAVIVENPQCKPEDGLSPKEFLEQNGWFDKKKTDSEKPLGWGYDIADKIPKYVEVKIDDHQEIDNIVEEGYNNLLNNREIVPEKPTLVHDSNYDEFIDELCGNIRITDIAKCLYGSSELHPEEFIQVYKMLTGKPETARRETYVSYSYTGVNPVKVTLDEQLLNKIIVAVIRKVAQEIKDTDKED